MTRERWWGAKSGVTLVGWEEDARGEAVEVGPSGEEVGLGEACPASWTCLANPREVERYGLFTEMTEDYLKITLFMFSCCFCVECWD